MRPYGAVRGLGVGVGGCQCRRHNSGTIMWPYQEDVLQGKDGPGLDVGGLSVGAGEVDVSVDQAS